MFIVTQLAIELITLSRLCAGARSGRCWNELADLFAVLYIAISDFYRQLASGMISPVQLLTDPQRRETLRADDIVNYNYTQILKFTHFKYQDITQRGSPVKHTFCIIIIRFFSPDWANSNDNSSLRS